MARKDEILKSFFTHELLIDKYKINKDSFPETVHDALKSEEPIVKAIAIIVDKLEHHSSISDNSLRNLINQFLNDVAI